MTAITMMPAALLLAGALSLTGCSRDTVDDDLDTAGYGTGADTSGYGSGSLGTGTSSADTTGFEASDTSRFGVDTTTNDTGDIETAP